MDWTARTESGATYTKRGSFITYEGSQGRTTFRAMFVRSSPEPSVAEPLATYLRNMENVDRPRVGERLYVADRDQWRLSTPIVSVEGD